jgi:hypothetical protein
MDVGSFIPSAGSVAPTGPVRPDPQNARQAVPTELPSSQSVVAAAAAAAARNDSARRVPSEPSVTHDVIIDPATREVIYRAVDVRSGQVIGQVPDEMQLQMAAYAQAIQRGLDHGKTLTEAEAQADLDVAV